MKRKNGKRLLLSLIILSLLVIGGIIYLFTTPAFYITNIEVDGNQKISVDTYVSLSKIELGTTNIFAVMQNQLKKNLKENAYIEDVTITRKLPNTLQLHVQERKVTYQVEYAEKYAYLNEQGYLLEINKDKQEDIILLKGLSSMNENIKVGSRLKEEDLKKLSVVLEITNYFQDHAVEASITSIDVTDVNHYTVYLADENKILYLGNASNISERLSLLKSILKTEKGKKGEIFMSGDLVEDKVYFREEVSKEGKYEQR